MPTTHAVAAALAQAWRTGISVAAPSTAIPDFDRPAAYVVQAAVVDQLDLGQRRGWKLGLTSLHAAAEPFTGPIHQRMLDEVSLAGTIRPRVEVELALVVGIDVGDPVTAEEAAELPLAVAASFEIIDDRTRPPSVDADWIADLATMRHVIAGRPRPWTGSSFADLVGVLAVDGTETAAGRVGETVMDPVAALAWLSSHLHERGIQIRAGDLVITGSLTGQVPLRPDRRYEAAITGLAPVTFQT